MLSATNITLPAGLSLNTRAGSKQANSTEEAQCRSFVGTLGCNQRSEPDTFLAEFTQQFLNLLLC